MTSLFRKLIWWLRRRRKEEELREELAFHLAQEAEERQTAGLPQERAAWAARRDLGNVALVQEDARTLWTWAPVEQVTQDVRYGLRMMFKSRMFTALAALSLALGIGANTAIYSFMDAILLRPLPVPDPAALVVMQWRSAGPAFGEPHQFVMHSGDGRLYREGAGTIGPIFPFPAFLRLREASTSVLSSVFAHKPAGRLNVVIHGEAELATGEYVSGDFFRGLAVSPLTGRLIGRDDDRPNAAPVAVLSTGYSQRRFGDAASSIGKAILINNVPVTVVGVTPPAFFGVDPAEAPHVYLPMYARPAVDDAGGRPFDDPNYYWIEIMGRLVTGVSVAQAQIALAGPFTQWMASSATNDGERANLPRLHLENGAGGLDSLKRQYATPLYVLWAMVALILAIACANTANLLLARASARKREMAVRLSIGAGRFRIVRQLLTESVLLASLSGVLGIVIAVAGIRVLTRLLANGQEGFTLHAELNWHVLGVTLGLSLLCGVLFGLAPALQLARPALSLALKDTAVTERRARFGRGIPRPGAAQALVVAQIAISLLLLVAAGLFVRTLTNLQSIPLGYNRDQVLLFELNAPQAGYPQAGVAAFYADLRRRLGGIPGVSHVTLSHASLVRAGRSHPVTANGVAAKGHRILQAGPGFFTTMQIPLLRGREFEERDREGSPPVAVVSDLFARTYYGDQDPVGQRLKVRGSSPLDAEIIGVAATARYGGLKGSIPPVVYLSYAQVPATQLQQMTFALRTDGDPLRHVGAVRQIVREADARVPLTNIKTQAADIAQTIGQELIFARLCTAFAVLALVIAGVGLYGTMAYAVARRTRELGIRIALGARRPAVIWMVLREVGVLAALGLAIGLPIARGTSRFIESFLFGVTPNDPRALTVAVALLVTAALVAGYGPARRASRVDPIVALRHE